MTTRGLIVSFFKLHTCSALMFAAACGCCGVSGVLVVATGESGKKMMMVYIESASLYRYVFNVPYTFLLPCYR